MTLKKIGIVVNTFGVAGDIKVISRTDFPADRFAVKKEILIDEKKYVIAKTREKADIIILHLQDLDDADKARLLKNKSIYEEVELPEGFFYLDDVMGFSVIDENGREYGKISDYREINGLYYFVVEQYLVPYIKNTFVVQIDFEKRKVIITDLAKGIFA